MKTRILFYIPILLPLMISANHPQEVVSGNNIFAFKLFHELNASSDKNLFYSPFSISTALAMTYAGARNETALQMSQAMNFQPSGEFHSDFSHLLNLMGEGTNGEIKLNIANGLWAQKDLKFLDSYLSLVTSNYHSEIKKVDFRDKAEQEKALKEINTWVEHKTNEKIKNLLDRGDLSSMTRLVLVNAIYFYGDWAKPFTKESTMPKDFFLADQARSNVPFMNQVGRYPYYEDSNIKAIEMPYKGDKASMVIFLPVKNNGMAEFEKSFNDKYYQEIIGSLQPNDVRLSLPKFQANFKINLETTLSQMGMPLAFSAVGADFSGMTGKRDLFISKVIHQAFINVDEKGTEAAAATAVTMKCTSARPPSDLKDFDADHPFIFLIKDNATGAILFMGKIMDPKISK
ncbi:MAG: serpin family protein [Bacteroidales bacterium]|nr:serpin family protein [Bacteroidales bacterium]